ncbi:MgtC/SapB family protein [Gluconacetobacter takamatsuzukensis]|uniref:Protein MgtC n=1 Tax=Gluconacetobacter takamatsuzukensis TaxID=1286190 RepID=A0A7W4KEE1_9PROT|nr:MgtC/SapB family protein [Gluconacetobacter takamatsuzukensis]MBB2205386.1 MgtC/SapB family protein [Gluconacetobacter takamatsuzukensis]
MHFIQTFNGPAFLDTIVSYLSAFLFGTLIGAERQYRQRTAGLRTNVLVAVGAAAFVDLAQRIAGDVEAVRVISYVVSGIGFLGAGVIMKDGTNVQGLNTAATLWCSAAVGACTGCDMVAEGGLLTIFVIAGNTLLRPLVNAIDRIPLQGRGVEASYTVSLLTDRAHVDALRDLLVAHLEQARFPVADVELTDRGADQVEIAATLTSTAVDRAELQRVIAHLGATQAVAHASWLVTPES